MCKIDLNTFDFCDFFDLSLSLCCSRPVVGIGSEALLDECDELRGVRVVIGDEVLLIDG